MSTINWNIDATHSEIGFKVRHLMISNVKGSFGKFAATLTTTEDDFSTAAISFEAEVASINTGNEQRDGHLRTGDFFDAEQFPTIKFVSTNVLAKGGNEFEVTGDLSIHGVTKSVTLQVNGSGLAKDPWGQIKTAFEINGKINRTDFGLVWNAPLETGGVLLSEDVYLQAEVQFVKA